MRTFGVQGGPGTRRSDPYGTTRTSVQARHALLVPDGIVSANPPGWRCAAFYTMISPTMGARFCQYHAEFGPDGGADGQTGENELVLYVTGGEIALQAGDRSEVLPGGGFAFLPPGTAYRLTPSGEGAAVLAFEKRYQPLPGTDVPPMVVGHEGHVQGAPFLGDPAAMLQTLLPDDGRFDLAVNIFKYTPGATLPFVETHVMEHGLLMLAGEGIYRLEDRWYPVRAGDAIWMAPYCPQWFVATGKAPASYIYYKDVNRWPTLG